MARGKLWSVKGISPEAREAARAAAQESGEPIGAWIDQAIRMSDEDLSGNAPNSQPADDDATALEIVRVLESLEARVASHAEHIARQLEPVRESIAALEQRLARIESGDVPAGPPEHDTPTAPVIPPETGEDDAPLDFSPHPAVSLPADPAPTDVPAPDTEYDGESMSGEHPSKAAALEAGIPDAGTPDGNHSSEHLPEEMAPEDPIPEDLAPDEGPAEDQPTGEEIYVEGPAHPAPESDVEATTAPQPRAVSEDNPHATDTTLNPEYAGLFDDGAHHGRPTQMERPGYDPRFPPPPVRRSSRAPLLFIAIVLLIACAGIGAFAWFQFTGSGVRSSFSLDDISFDNLVAKLEDVFTPDSFTPESTEVPVARREAPTPPTTAPEPQPDNAATTETPPVSKAAPVLADSPPPAEPADPEVTRLITQAAAGDAKAQNELGTRYLVGRGVTQDYAEAARWLQGAAAKGVTSAQYNLGVLYDSGRGVEADPTQALFWFHNAAEKGHGRAQMAMAAAYAAGRGIERNPDEALKWLRAASESNIPDAQLSLANILASSPEKRESLIDALFWYRVADANGVADAAVRGDQVASQLTAEERAGVNRRVSHFVAQKLSQPRAPAAPLKDSAATPPAPAPAATAPAAATPPPVPATPSTRRDTAEVARIKEIQTLLGRLGFDPGPADGSIGEKTRNAIRSYQKELNLPVDGEPSDDLLQHLRKIIGAG